ncbi:hypothetical protein [Hymenobacter sp. BRD67]|uniref:hypothetical protein n=1 Tax=Hymenobacter sp. BRD67 TaxID=2675877 RepID=UPI0039777A84
MGTTITDVNGAYSFNAAPGTYTVRTVMPTVKSARPNGTTANPAPMPVQTYVRNDPNRVGGENPAATTDSPAVSTTTGVTLSFVAQNTSGLNNVAFIDNVEVLTSSGTVSPNPISNQGFETPSAGGSVLSGPFTAGWTFNAVSGSSYDGIVGNSGLLPLTLLTVRR